jgi:hypothetical protein
LNLVYFQCCIIKACLSNEDMMIKYQKFLQGNILVSTFVILLHCGLQRMKRFISIEKKESGAKGNNVSWIRVSQGFPTSFLLTHHLQENIVSALPPLCRMTNMCFVQKLFCALLHISNVPARVCGHFKVKRYRFLVNLGYFWICHLAENGNDRA